MSSNASVFSLLTKLCEHHLSLSGRDVRHKDVVKLRRKCFEILLTPNKPEPDPYWLPNQTIENQFLAWQYTLRTCKRPQDAQQLEECYKAIQNFDWSQDVKDSFLTFLMKLRKLPKGPEVVKTYYPRDRLQSFVTEGCLYIPPLDAPVSPNDLFRPEVRAHRFVTGLDSVLDRIPTLDFWNNTLSPSDSNPFCLDVQTGSSDTERYFWDQIAPTNFEMLKTWETGEHSADIEGSFTTDNDDIYDTLDQMYASETPSMEDAALQGKRTLSSEEYLRDVKYLLIGIRSVSFLLTEDTFTVNPDIIFMGITRNMFLQYSELLINCGVCYKALRNLTSDALAHRGEYGAIYDQLCHAIQRFLHFYHAATFKFYDGDVTLLQIHKECRKLSRPLLAMASLCKVGLFKECGVSLPTGVDLLNYLYRQTFSCFAVKTIDILVGLLFSCHQRYFIQFLRPWLLEGTVKDSSSEFFIQVSERFISTQDRQYWNRAFNVVDRLVPWFLIDHAKTILHCGKSVHFLKQCQAQSRNIQYFRTQKPNLIQVCVTHKMLQKLERNMKAYELRMLLAVAGTPFTLQDWLAKKEDKLLILCKSAAVKRYMEYQRIQTTRVERIEMEYKLQKARHIEKRRYYEEQLAAKQEYNMCAEMQELKEERQILSMRKNLGFKIREEATRMIERYEEISQNAIDIIPTIVDIKGEVVTLPEAIESQPTALQSIEEEPVGESRGDLEPLTEVDIINANEILNTTHLEKFKENIQTDLDNVSNMDTFAEAEHNKQKVMSSSVMTPVAKSRTITNTVLTDVQQNKLKVIAEEYGESPVNQSEFAQNRTNALRSQIVLREDILNENLSTTETNKNQLHAKGDIENTQNVENQCVLTEPLVPKDSEVNLISSPAALRRQRNVSQDLHYFEYKPLPYVVTPISDGSPLFVGATAATTSSYDSNSASNKDDVFNLNTPLLYLTADQAKEVCYPIIDNFIQHSIMLSLNLQTTLLNEDLLKYYIDGLNYLSHLETIRNYFFLLDGDFCQSVTKDFFGSLYTINCPALWKLHSVFFNIPTKIRDDLRIRLAVDSDVRILDLSDIHILDCLSVVYKINWPLTVLIPKDTLEKYNDIFKFLLKIHRVAWILQRMFANLRSLNKSNVRRLSVLRISPHYQRVQLCRHILTHFVQTLQNYIVGEVLHSGWAEFQTALKSIDNIDDLYSYHANYLKQIHFLCFLNKKANVVSQVVFNIFIVILKYNDYLRSEKWTFHSGVFEHPNFNKLEVIFENFLELARHFFRVGTKLANSACQPQLAQLIGMLNVNDFYSSRL